MSNMTEGKKALSDGDFETAARKLDKALSNRPNDSELWWSLMLCKYRVRDDGELVDKLRSEFEAAAREGRPAPATPFETPYCKNALKYAINTRRQGFVENTYKELSKIMEDAGGKPLRAVRVQKPAKKHIGGKATVFFIATYVMLAGVFAGDVLLSCGIMSYNKAMLWTGFAFFLAFTVLAMGARGLSRRAGRDPKGSVIILMSAFGALCVALLAAGIKVDSTAIITVAAIALAVVIIFIAITAYTGKNDEKKPAGRNVKAEKARLEYDRQNVIRAAKEEDKEKKTSEYEDTFD